MVYVVIGGGASRSKKKRKDMSYCVPIGKRQQTKKQNHDLAKIARSFSFSQITEGGVADGESVVVSILKSLYSFSFKQKKK